MHHHVDRAVQRRHHVAIGQLGPGQSLYSSMRVTDKLRRKGIGPNEIARTTIQRGGEIFLLALLFRMQEYLLGFFHRPWTDLLRVDILNAIGLSAMLMGLACRIAAVGGRRDAQHLRKTSVGVAAAIAAALCAHTLALFA